MRVIRALFLFALSTVLATLMAYFLVIRPRLREWGADPHEAALPIPGDDLVPQPTATETRGITIDAPVSKVWPWLVQMGYERAGWYSYDALDNKGPSADRILPEFQTLSVGDIMPTHPGGGFRVEVVEPERALVLYIDTELGRQQAEQAQAEGKADLPTPGLKFTGAVGAASLPEFSVSWAFFLQPVEDGKTRLIERFRARTPGGGPANAVFGEIMGTGVVLMTRKQMLGIKERVEGTAVPFDHFVDEPVLELDPDTLPVHKVPVEEEAVEA
jgi:proline iminopeptidase